MSEAVSMKTHGKWNPPEQYGDDRVMIEGFIGDMWAGTVLEETDGTAKAILVVNDPTTDDDAFVGRYPFPTVDEAKEFIEKFQFLIVRDSNGRYPHDGMAVSYKEYYEHDDNDRYLKFDMWMHEIPSELPLNDPIPQCEVRIKEMGVYNMPDRFCRNTNPGWEIYAKHSGDYLGKVTVFEAGLGRSAIPHSFKDSDYEPCPDNEGYYIMGIYKDANGNAVLSGKYRKDFVDGFLGSVVEYHETGGLSLWGELVNGEIWPLPEKQDWVKP